jgi:hypothetical protein
MMKQIIIVIALSILRAGSVVAQAQDTTPPDATYIITGTCVPTASAATMDQLVADIVTAADLLGYPVEVTTDNPADRWSCGSVWYYAYRVEVWYVNTSVEHGEQQLELVLAAINPSAYQSFEF